MLTFALCALLAAEPEPPRPKDPHPVTTPWFLPRYAYVGIFLNQYVAAPTVRVGWEITLYDDVRNLLSLAVELGPGFAVARPAVATHFWEHAAIGGLGYRWGRAKGFQWGFLIGAGAVLGGATFDPPVGVPGRVETVARDERVLGFVEGRLYAGWRFAPLLVALAFGYGSPLSRTLAYPSSLWVGGFTLGVMVNWR